MCKWLHKEFGYQVTPGSLESVLDEHELEWHLIYASVFNDPEVRSKALQNRERLARKGIFSAMIEFGSGSSEEPEPEDPEGSQPSPM